jgi:hypothetical protein
MEYLEKFLSFRDVTEFFRNWKKIGQKKKGMKISPPTGKKTLLL